MPLPGGSRPIRDPSAPYGSADAFADYALLDRLNRPLAVVEAKRTSRSPVEGERQAADSDEIERLREPIVEHLGLLPAELPEIRAHLEQLAWAQSAGFWDHLDYPRIMELQDTFAPLMRFGQRRPAGEMIRLTLPDPIAHRHWIVFGPAGEGAFVESYREQVEAFIRDLAEDSPALQRLRAGHELTDGELDSVAQLLNRPDLFVTEQRLRLAFGQPDASLAELLRHILTEAKLPNRERQISAAFEKWVAGHAQLNATP
jgi:type I restriction enzyme R subunit